VYVYCSSQYLTASCWSHLRIDWVSRYNIIYTSNSI